jgi:hypothetical protein
MKQKALEALVRAYEAGEAEYEKLCNQWRHRYRCWT